MNIFIDTNVFLSFYHFTSDDLEELNKLGVLLAQGKARLFLPDQVVQEFRRNRENKIADALKKLRSQKLGFQFPQFCKNFPEYDNLRQLQRSYGNVHATLVEKVTEDITSQSLKADSVITGLFDLATRIPIDEEIVERANRRLAMGNPPGKDGSLGDALNWEALVTTIEDGENINFITDDKDFSSPLDANTFSGFLLEEWAETKNSSLLFYKSLSTFFKEHFPEISLASEYEKDLLIRHLANSESFSETHAIIAKLRKYSDFTMTQINAIVEAAISNAQVNWIIEDWDVEAFFRDVVKGKEEHIKSSNFDRLNELLKPEATEDDILF